MINITLPDGSVRQYDAAVTGHELAADIGPGLAKAALAMVVNGTQRDLTETITQDSDVTFLTTKTEEGLEVMRHTMTAQTLARAVKELYPSAKLAIGPTVENGFYYDIEFSEPLSSDDLPKIEARMKAIMQENNPVSRELWEPEKVRSYFADRGETYKVELVDGAVEKGELIDGKYLSVWRQTIDGKDDFIDLCRGPHAVRTGQLVADGFTLTNIAGAYWRGDSNNTQLTRIYGVSFADKKALKQYLHLLEEAKKRDHRKLGMDLDLFHFSDRAPGQVFWHPKGWSIYLELMAYMRRKINAHNYVEVCTPQLMDLEFWQWSGHWDKYRENMFVAKEADESVYALKPMSCPGDAQIFNYRTVSYRELPLRMAEFGHVFRREASGARHGLMRVQAFTQDDAHIFCTPDQLEDEVVAMCDLIAEVYKELGFENVKIKFSTRPDMRIGSEEDWDKAEAVLQRVVDRLGLPWELNPGDGAFYAPKLDFVLTDAIGREWQCGTVQVDMNLPTRLNMEYDAPDGTRQRPHMVHRAILGSVERFMGILIENYAGHLPLWLSPVQAVTMGITDKQSAAVDALTAKMKAAGLRVNADLRNEKVSYKVREHSLQKVPYILVLGDREVADGTVTVRQLGSEEQVIMPVDELIAQMQAEIRTYARPKLVSEANAEAA